MVGGTNFVYVTKERWLVKAVRQRVPGLFEATLQRVSPVEDGFGNEEHGADEEEREIKGGDRG